MDRSTGIIRAGSGRLEFMRAKEKKSPLLRRLGHFWALLPAGGLLPEDIWRRRHRFLLGLTWLHAAVIASIGPIAGYSWNLSLRAVLNDDSVLHTFAEGLVVASFAFLAGRSCFKRAVRASLVAIGLITSSAIFVHLSGGYIELHFHFFVMLVFLALYQDWLPFGLAILYVAVHHGVLGVLWPREVYNHAAAIAAPWTWAGIHAFFVLFASVGSIIAWRFNEKAHAQIQLILDSAGEGIYGVDLEGKATFFNPAAAEMLGYEIQELIGRNVHDLLHHSRPDGTPYPREACPIYAAFRDGAVHSGADDMFWRRDGRGVPVEYASTPIIERGEILGAVVTFRDVTYRKKSEQVLRQKVEELQQKTAELVRANQVKNQFLNVMSHELRTPLSVVMGYAGVLKEGMLGKTTPEQAEALAKIMSRTEDLLRMITSILYATSIAAREVRVESRPFALSALLDELRGQQGGIRKPLALDWDWPDDLPAMISDREKTKYILQTLIDNAVKFTERGRVSVSAGRMDTNGSGAKRSWIELKVADTGIGIPKEKLPMIFEKFWQADGSETRLYGGVGLGLYIAKNFAELLEGKIEVETGEGEGSTFTVRLPVALRAASENGLQEEALGGADRRGYGDTPRLAD